MPIVATKVHHVRHVASAIVFLQLERPPEFSWTTGQCVSLGLHGETEDVFRAYSIASPGDSATVDFVIGAVAGGTLSPRLAALKEGDEVLFNTEAFGSLYEKKFPEGASDLWLFASGTGVSPFIAFAHDASVMNKYERVFLVHSVRTWEETQYVKELVGEVKNLHLITDVTREDGPGLHERIPAALEDGSLEKAAGAQLSIEQSRVMLCGNPVVVQAIRDALKPRGFVSPRRGKPGQLLAENF